MIGAVAAGQYLSAAQGSGAVPYGQWEAWLRDRVQISPGYARKLIAIASNPTLTDRSHVNDLPHDVASLYRLAAIPAEPLAHAIDSGSVWRGMTRGDAAMLAYTMDVADKPKTKPSAKDDKRSEISKAIDVFALDLDATVRLLRKVPDGRDRFEQWAADVLDRLDNNEEE